MHRSIWGIAPFILVGTSAQAGEIPLYQPAPAWIVKAPLDISAADAPPRLLFDQQIQAEGDQLWVYSDSAIRLATNEMLGQFATMTLPWLPDKGDLIVHEFSILRDGQEIDVMAEGRSFTVLRREQGLERRQMTGLLSATLPVAGLQIGDVVRLRTSTTIRDAALGGHVQYAAPMLAEPMRIGAGQVRLLWDRKVPVRWKLLGRDIPAKPVRKGELMELSIPLPVVKQADMPFDAPMRFRPPPLLELSTFASWPEVSRTFAPLYATDGLIRADGPLAVQLAVVKAEKTLLEQAQRALRIVQDEIRYLALGMNGGNYVPQKPEESWSLRYGDCKAKTVLLLALLRGAGIEAEAVLAHSRTGDLLPDRLPSAAAFDHVLVRAVIDGRTYWLDGTRSGGRIEDIGDTPAFRHVLPLRRDGAELMPLVMHKDARPSVDVSIDADESASVDLPAPFTITLRVRGPGATALSLMAAQTDKKQRHKMLSAFLGPFAGAAQYGETDMSVDAVSGTTTVTGKGIRATAWKWEDMRMKRSVTRTLADAAFGPDRARPAWAAIPVATPDPNSLRYSMRLRLPNGGKDMVVDGDGNASGRVAGRDFARTMTIADGILSIEERVENSGTEIAAVDVPAERDRFDTVLNHRPRLIAPATVPRAWAMDGRDPAAATQIAAAEAVYTGIIGALQPGDSSAYYQRALMRLSISNRTGALADLTQAIAISPSPENYRLRARVQEELGHKREAVADAEKALAMNPSNSNYNVKLAELLDQNGQADRAIALLDKRIEVGGPDKESFQRWKAQILALNGKPDEAIAMTDRLIAEKPGSAELLNLRCWVKGIGRRALDTAAQDCTRAIELSPGPRRALDSRALVYFRLGRLDEALADLDSALSQRPDQEGSLFLRGIILKRLGRKSEAAADLAAARHLQPQIDTVYARYGVTG